jgi:hypothetical protein
VQEEGDRLSHLVTRLEQCQTSLEQLKRKVLFRFIFNLNQVNENKFIIQVKSYVGLNLYIMTIRMYSTTINTY